jgi:hypothetical protein
MRAKPICYIRGRSYWRWTSPGIVDAQKRVYLTTIPSARRSGMRRFQIGEPGGNGSSPPAALEQNRLGHDPLSGRLCVFRSRRGDTPPAFFARRYISSNRPDAAAAIAP